jgi:CRISPR system Cascade subunit CasB
MTNKHHIIEYLLDHQEDKGILASLRRGVGEKPGTCPAMFPIIAPLLPADCSHKDETLYYLIAGLFAFHPLNCDSGNMGNHLRKSADENTLKAAERRFSALLSVDEEDLPTYLRQAISMLKSKDTRVNWNQLMSDLKYWGHPDKFIQRQWANAFWYEAKTQGNENNHENAGG